MGSLSHMLHISANQSGRNFGGASVRALNACKGKTGKQYIKAIYKSNIYNSYMGSLSHMLHISDNQSGRNFNGRVCEP